MPMSFAEAIPVDLFRTGQFRWRLLTRAIPESSWLQVDDQRETYRTEKAALLATRLDDCVVHEPGSEAAAQEVLRLVLADLLHRGIDTEVNGSLHPIDAAGRLVQEDLVVMERKDRGWVLTSASVCFPTRWDLRSKLGRTMDEIHEPVPQYAEMVGSVVNRFFDRLQAGRLVWRPNWSLVADPALRLDPPQRRDEMALPSDPGNGLWLRVERQSVRRLVEHPDAVCFAVRVHRWPLAEILENLQGSAFSDELAAIPIDIASYKNIENIREQLGRWLETRSGS